MCKNTLLLAVFMCMTSCALGANILGIFPTNTHSHYVMYGSLMREMTKRGHHVTSVNHFPLKMPMDNFTDISLDGTLPALANNISIDVPLSMSPLDNHFDIIEDFHRSCEIGLNHPKVLELLNPKYKFDILVTEIFGSECFLAIAHKLGIPSVGIVSSVMLPWVNDMVANPDNPAYVPLYYYPLTQWMNFYERTYNTVMSLVIKLTYEIMSNWKAQRIAESALGPLPSIASLARNFSLILTNSHFSINQVRPFVPQIIEVGGLHIKKPGILPPDLETFLSESTHGVIYFSFGSMLKIESFPQEKLKQIINTLGSLNQRILWKVNSTNLPPLPPNIRTGMWMPQLEILCHPSTKLFISHGGLLGSQEAINCGVPILGIPLFADQALNLAELKKRGVVKIINYNDFNEVTIFNAINNMLNDTSYVENMKYLSRLFTDRPQHPMDTAIYWLEYVIKYGGAKHLRSAALDLKWYQYLLLDVIGFLLISVIVVFVIVKWCFKAFISMISKNNDVHCKNTEHTVLNNNNIYQNGKHKLNGMSSNGHSYQNGNSYIYCNGTMYSESIYKKEE